MCFNTERSVLFFHPLKYQSENHEDSDSWCSGLKESGSTIPFRDRLSSFPILPFQIYDEESSDLCAFVRVGSLLL